MWQKSWKKKFKNSILQTWYNHIQITTKNNYDIKYGFLGLIKFHIDILPIWKIISSLSLKKTKILKLINLYCVSNCIVMKKLNLNFLLT